MIAPILIAGAGIVFVVLAIAVARVHAFFGLVLAAMLVALLGVAAGVLDGGYVAAVETVMNELGKTAGAVAFVIVAAAVIGVCLTESGAATRIVDALLHTFGERRAGLALLIGGFILSIPVFFDTVFILLLPLARALARRTGGCYTYYLLAICAGGVISHSSVPPTPGPTILAELLRLDLGVAMIAGLVAGVPAMAVGLALARWLAGRVPISPPSDPGASPEAVHADPMPLGLALLPVVVPLSLIAFATLTGVGLAGQAVPGGWRAWVQLLGNKNIALLIALVMALLLVVRQRGRSWREMGPLVGRPLEIGAAIVLITSAGGAFGAMIKRLGIGEAVQVLTDGAGMDRVLLAWILAVIIRVAQGSATVAMMTSGAIMLSLEPAAGAAHPIYVYLAIGYGSFFCSWMNDSGFWLVSRLGGLTEREALRSWTVLVSGISVAGLMLTWIASRLLPLA